ncbi:uncharacterized protein LOC126661279 [Mercurialis annua]|uniref:uncharacterized protein LOC126661279 n=1 Tax=Mercurialis annua TaxID=3986 RepID=UPI00215FD52A|nr:uncharacterized protein LOC126661279 [Mercurialis annua]
MNSNSSSQPKKPLPAESVPLFQEGLFLTLSRWSALQLAVENEWAGKGSLHLADQLRSDVFFWFTQSKEALYIDDLEEILDRGMETLNVGVEDGSVEEVAEKLMIMHEECLEGNYHSIEKLRQAGPTTGAHQHIRQANDDDDDDDEDDDEDNENSMGDNTSNMIVDAPNHVGMQINESSRQEAQGEDGWEVVSSKKNRGRRS